MSMSDIEKAKTYYPDDLVLRYEYRAEWKHRFPDKDCPVKPVYSESPALNTDTEYKVNGYSDRWAVVATYKEWALLENCTYGDETCFLVVNLYLPSVMQTYKIKAGASVTLPTIFEVVCETYDGLITALEEEGLISEDEAKDAEVVLSREDNSKSFAAKYELINKLLSSSDDVIVVDPDKEM